MRNFVHHLHQLFFGGPDELLVKYCAFFISTLISPFFYVLFWRWGLPPDLIIAVGVATTVAVFIVIVLIGHSLIKDRERVHEEEPRRRPAPA